MRKFLGFIIALSVAGVAYSCTDLTEVNKKLDSLDSRVYALEKTVNSLNKNVLALMNLAQNQTINSVVEEGDTYKITLSNGQELEIYQGTMGVANTPVMSIDDKGYWQVDYGAGPEPVLQGGKPVSALGVDGITPTFGVDDDNYWIVSYDDGAIWSNVLYSSGAKEGQKVKAYDEGGTDSYFHNVEYKEDEGVFILTLKNGNSYSVPVVSDFFCKILNAEDIQKFDYGQTRTYTVETMGVNDHTVIAPYGWNAVLQGDDDKILKITAPEDPAKSTIADSESDVTIIAFSKAGLSTSSRIEVALTGQEPDTRPFTSPSKLEVGTIDAKVRVLVENATDWYYLLSTSETQPHASEIIADGVRGTEHIFTLTGLKQAYTYYLYTTAEKNGQMAPVSQCSFKTGITNDRYQAFLDGEDIIICGEHYNINNTASYKLLTATQDFDTSLKDEMPKGGIIFLETPAGTSFDPAPGIDVKNETETILVGRYADSRAKIKLYTGRLNVKAGLAMEYVELDGTGRKGNEFMTKETAKYVRCESCRFLHTNGTPLLYAGDVGIWKSVRLVGNDVKIVGPNAGSVHFITTVSWASIAMVDELTIDNNIFYFPSDTRMHMFFPGENFDKEKIQSFTRTKVSVCNNTFYGGASDWSMIRLYVAGDIKLQKNIYWFYSGSIVKQADMVDLFGDDGVAPSVVFENNISYRGDIRALAGNVNIEYLPSPNTVTSLASDPLAGCNPDNFDFTPIPAYSKYGAQR